MLNASHRRQSGFMAIVLVVFLVVFTAIAAAIVSMTTSGARSAGDHVNAVQALFAAESGFEWAAGELLGAGAAGCADMDGAGQNIGDDATFILSDAELVDGNCRLTSRGEYRGTARVLTGAIPQSVLDGGGGGGGDLFEDTEFNCNSNNVTCQNGELTFSRPGGQGQGQPPTQANGADLITDEFTIGDEVYFTANIAWDADPSNNTFGLEMNINSGANIDCEVLMPALTSPCSASAGHPLYDEFDIVLALGDYFGKDNVGQVKIRIDWEGNASNQVTLSNGCIGRAGYCSGEASDDPVDDGSWNEDP